MKTRENEFDITKAMAIYMVVLGHLLVAGGVRQYALISFCHMPAFFFISGYFLSSSLERYSSKELLGKKTKTLLLPYVIWSLISFCANMALAAVQGRFSVRGMAEEFCDILLYARSVWFLLQLYLSTAVFVVVAKLAERRHIDRYLALMGVWLVLSLLLPAEPLCLYKFKWLFPFMVLGSWAADHKERLRPPKRAGGLGLLAIPAYILAVALIHDRTFAEDYLSFGYTFWNEAGGGYSLLSYKRLVDRRHALGGKAAGPYPVRAAAL